MAALHKCFFVCVLAFLIALPGCIDVLSSEQRELCLEMTSYARTSVPVCSTQEECFASVEGSLGLQGELFSADMRTSLNLYKNYLALSWLHYSRAMENTRNIHNICHDAETGGLSQLVPQVNELNRNLLNAFAAVDAANTESFTALLIQKQGLEGQDVNLVREEPLFNDYANINTNLNLAALAEPGAAIAAAGTDSYTGFYLSRIAVFEQATTQLGFPPSKARRYSAFDLLARYDSQLLKASPGQALYIRFAIDAALGLIEHINGMLTLGRAKEALQHVPTFELLNAYNDLAGVGNSAPSKFAELINSTHSHVADALIRAKTLKAETAENLSALDSAVSALDSSAYAAFDQNFLATLYALLSPAHDSGIAASEHGFNELSEFKQHALSEALDLRRMFESMLQREARSQITLGGRISELKQLSSDSALLLEEVHYTSTEAISNLEVLCTERVSAIEQEINASQNGSEFGDGKTTAVALEAADLSARILHRISRFHAAETAREKLLLCRPVVEDFLLLGQAVNDLDAYEHAAGERIKECMGYLHAVFAGYADELPGPAAIYPELLAVPKPYTNPASVIAKCESLKASTDLALAGLPEFKALYENHAASQKMLAALKEISMRSPGSIPEPALAKLEKKFLSEGELFEQGVIDAGALVAELPKGGAAASSELAEQLTEEFASALAEHLAETAALELFPKGIAVLNKPLAVRGRITLDNTIAPCGKEISVAVEFPETDSAQLVYATPNLLHWRLDAAQGASHTGGSVMRLAFSSMPPGKSVAEFDFSTGAATAETHTEIIALSPRRALLLQTLALSTPGNIVRLLVQTRLPGAELGAENILVYFSGQEQHFGFARDQTAGQAVGQALEFALNNIKDPDSVEIYYSIPNPIIFNAELVSIEEAAAGDADENRVTYTYELSLQNRLPMLAGKTRVAVPLPVEPGSILGIALHRQDGTKINVSALPNNTLSFLMPALEPGQQAKFSLSITAQDAGAYWHRVLGQAALELSALANSPHAGVGHQAGQLLEQLQGLQQNFDWQSPLQVQQAQQTIAESAALLAAEQDLGRKQAEFGGLSSEVGQKIEEAETRAGEFDESGFAGQADAAREALQKAEREMQSAEQFRLAADYNSAILHLLSARSLLAELPGAGVGEIICADRNRLMEGANKLFADAHTLALAGDLNLTALRGSILGADAAISRALAQQDLLMAKQQLDALEKATSDYNSALAVAIERAAQNASQEIETFENLLETCSGLADELGVALAGEDEELLNAAAYTPPITNGRLSKLKSRLQELEPNSLQKGIAEFRKKFEQSNYADALEHYNNHLSAELERPTSAAEKIKKELSSALSSLKEDAKSALSKALTKAKFAEYSAEAEHLLSAASDSAEKERYLKTVLLAKNATALMAFAEPQEFGVPLAVLPFLCLIAAALLLRWHSRKAEASKKPLRIPRLKKA